MKSNYWESADPWQMFVGIVVVALVVGLLYTVFRLFNRNKQ